MKAHHELRRQPFVRNGSSRKFRTTTLCTSLKQNGLKALHRAFYRLHVIEVLKATLFRVWQGKRKTISSEETAVGSREAAKAVSRKGSAKLKN